MSSFTSQLIVQPLEDGKTWRVMRSFSFHIGSRHSRKVVTVPKGFKTDFASIPKFLWFLPYWAKYSKAPVLHDYLYTRQDIHGEPVTRKEADDIFLEAMLVCWNEKKSRYLVAYIEYIAVRLFGWKAW